MFQKGSRHEIVRNCHALLVDIEAEKNNNDDVIEVVRQIVNRISISILARIERFLSSSSSLKG